ncbi:cytochrome b5 domain-containing protein [Halobacteriota archaeon]
MRNFTKRELVQYNGKRGALAFIAYKKKVYDISSSFLWRGGNHQITHNAGEDLTEDLKKAPHGADMLNKFPVVGILHKD